jgi:hypothetical protein
VAPITLRVKVAKVQTHLLPKADVGDGTGNLARHEGASTTRALVVEEDAIASVHVVGLTVVLRDPECIKLRDTVGAARVKRSVLVLRDGLNQSVKLRSRGLVEPYVALEAAGAYGIEKAQGTEGIDVACIFRHVEGDLYVRLRTEIVDFGWLDLREDVYEIRTVRQVPVMELELVLPRTYAESACEKRT